MSGGTRAALLIVLVVGAVAWANWMLWRRTRRIIDRRASRD